jgi:hypothetical protein
MAATVERKLAPVRKVSLVPPLPLCDEAIAIEQFRIARPRMASGMADAGRDAVVGSES